MSVYAACHSSVFSLANRSSGRLLSLKPAARITGTKPSKLDTAHTKTAIQRPSRRGLYPAASFASRLSPAGTPRSPSMACIGCVFLAQVDAFSPSLASRRKTSPAGEVFHSLQLPGNRILQRPVLFRLLQRDVEGGASYYTRSSLLSPSMVLRRNRGTLSERSIAHSAARMKGADGLKYFKEKLP